MADSWNEEKAAGSLDAPHADPYFSEDCKKAFKNFVETFERHVGSTAGNPFANALSKHFSSAATFFPTAFCLVMAHLFCGGVDALPITGARTEMTANKTAERFIPVPPLLSSAMDMGGHTSPPHRIQMMVAGPCTPSLAESTDTPD
jgi:hypothetical protein